MNAAERDRIRAAAKEAAMAAPPLTDEQKAQLRVLLAPLARTLADMRRRSA